MSEMLLQNAIRLHQSGNLMEAARIYSDVLRADPRQIEAMYRLGSIHLQSGRYADAERLFVMAIRLNPEVPELFYARGSALQKLQRPEDALAAFAQALAIRPGYLEARHDRGVTLLDLRRYTEALACFDKVLAESPGLAFVENNRAVALNGLGRYDDALTATERVLAATGNSAAAWYQRGAALAGLARLEDAVQSFGKAIAIDPRNADAYSYRSIVLLLLNRFEESLADCNNALRIRPGDLDLLFNRAGTYIGLKRFEDAISDTEGILQRDPEYRYAFGNLIQCKLQLADWRTLEEDTSKTLEGVRAGRAAIRPLQCLLISKSESDQLRSAQIWADHPQSTPLWRGERYKHKRPRVAYISADFREHAVASLMAGVFEAHDQSRVETVALSIGPDDGSAMRKRLSGAFGRFIEGRNRSDAELADILHDLEIDIAVDLMGYTEGSRTGIFARRPAPLQVNYLGYPGTMGAPYYDYILADGIVAPFAQQPFYSEKIVHLPHCYLPNDSKRRIAEKKPSRSEAGLPDEGFVFCALNNIQKILPPMFDIWMRLLAGVDGSVLWLSRTGPAAMRNLRHEAEARGIAGERLIFASHAPTSEDHLARLALADLFLDTLPYNAHASACDVLWAGVPIVTTAGAQFSGRVGASLLTAAGLPELIAPSLADYESLALRLARDPAALAAVKRKVVESHGESPLFNTAHFARDLKAAYIAMWERQQRGEKPANFAVASALSVS